MTDIDYKKERENDTEKIKNSEHPRKVIVAGPGTGKSFLFSELIKKKRAEGKTNFLAITFIGKLGDSLADDLCGLADTSTMHGFARKFVRENYQGCEYYPNMHNLIAEDLKSEGIDKFKIGDDNYKKKTVKYRAVGDADVVYYAVEICKKDPNKIPKYDLILIDEYQDFNSIESEFVDLLAEKNEIVIVGDDDQALYGFKGSSPSFIREKYDSENEKFESHTLRFCSRCTQVIIKYFHNIVDKFKLNESLEAEPSKKRIRKDYICYAPDKIEDSNLNNQINLIKKCPPGMLAHKIRSELEKIIKAQKIKEVLVIGEGQSCKTLLRDVSAQLKNYGFKNVDYKGDDKIFDIQQDIVDAYKFIAKDEDSLLGWRILGNPDDPDIKKKHISNTKTLKKIIDGTPRALESISNKAIEKLENEIEIESVPDKMIRKKAFFRQIKQDNIYLPRPLSSLNITVCNILNSKGLGADVVFVIGFDQGRFPSKKTAKEDEIYQMLVALTRAKKRIYFINTVKKTVSSFIDCIDEDDISVEEINL